MKSGGRGETMTGTAVPIVTVPPDTISVTETGVISITGDAPVGGNAVTADVPQPANTKIDRAARNR